MAMTSEDNRCPLLRRLAVLSGIGTAAVVFAISTELHLLHESTEQAQTDIDVFTHKRNRIVDLEPEVIKLRESVGELLKVFPDDRERSTILDPYHNFASYAGVEIESINSKMCDLGCIGLDKVVFRFKVSGTLTQVVRFASLIENYRDRMTISYWDVSCATTNGKQLSSVLEIEKLCFEGFRRIPKAHIGSYEDKRVALRDEITRSQTTLAPRTLQRVENEFIPDVFGDSRAATDHSQR